MTGKKSKTVGGKTGTQGQDGMNILLVDSSQTFIRYLDLVVRRWGYHVHSARSANEAMEVLEKVPIGLVLVEDNLPDIGGDELARRIHENRPTSGLPILLVTGDTRKRGGRALDLKVFSAELKKPINIQALGKSLHEHFPLTSRRSSIRAPLRLKVDLTDGQEKRTLLTLSLGEGGVFVETSASWPVGTTLDIFIPLPGQEKAVKVKGKVIYTVSGEGMRQRPGMGIRFTRISEKARGLLAEYLEDFVVDFVP